jgi:Undecaprenyl-phosphate galactose phosphotransferase WbaP
MNLHGKRENNLMDDIHIVPSKRWLEILLLLASDLIGFGIAIGLVAVARHELFHVQIDLAFDAPGVRTVLYLILFSLAMLIARGLYPGWKRSSVVELKQIVEAITLAFVLTSMIIFVQRSWTDFSRSVYFLTWFFSIFIIPIGRFLVRKFVARFPWWGEPVVVIGTKARVREVAKQLASSSRLGLRPAIGLAVDDIVSREGDPIPILPWSQKQLNQVQKTGIRTSILASSSSDLRKDHPKIFRHLELSFNKTVFILDDDFFSFMMAQPVEIAGQPAILSQLSLLEPVNLFVKRLIDILFIVLFFIPILIVGGLLALWIRIDSPGPIFFIQERIGRNRKIFLVYKFRTMFQNADDALAKLLESPDMRDEWEHYHKLVDDRRITRVGNWLRRLSLDELPQVINILRGEMSLVGPRPYMLSEINKIGDAAQIVLHVRPGITGWWQVMGRNKLSFQERIRLELYYVSNWSLWLDLFIMIKTFWVMLFLRDGK